MSKISVDKNEYERLLNMREKQRDRQKKYQQKQRSIAFVLPKDDSEVLDQIATSLGHKSGASMMKAYALEWIKQELERRGLEAADLETE